MSSKAAEAQHDKRRFEPLGSPAHVSMTALTFSETAGAQRAERQEAGVKLPNSRIDKRDNKPRLFGKTVGGSVR